MTELDRKALIRELDAVMRRATTHIDSKGPVSAAVALARTELAKTLKTDIEAGAYDLAGSSARDYFLETLRMRWFKLTPRERRQLYKLDSLLKISVEQLADPHQIPEGTPTEAITQTLATPKPRRSPWTWPLWALVGLLVIVLGGTIVAINFPV